MRLSGEVSRRVWMTTPRRGTAAAASLALILLVGAPRLTARAEHAATPDPVASEVLRNLTSSPLGNTVPRLRWRVVISRSRHINAYSDGTGAIFVTGGLAYVLGGDRGLWAAVLGHEVGHAVIRPEDGAYLPGFEKELDRLSHSPGVDPPSAESILRIERPGGGVRRLTLDREREFEADRVGLLLMAAAGYHPDYATAFDRRIQFFLGDHPKYDDFLLGHPRWEDREQNNARTEPVALAIFNSRWPDPAKAPGGKAPPLGVIETVEAHAMRDGKLELRIPLHFRNAAGAHMRVSVNFLDEGQIVRTRLAQYGGPGGMLALTNFLPDTPTGSTTLRLQVPLTAFDTPHRRLKAVAFLMSGDQTLGVYIQPIDLALSAR